MNAINPSAPSAGQVALTYAAVASAWLLVSDQVIDRAFAPGDLRDAIMFVDVWCFVAVTSLVLHRLLRRHFQAQGRSFGLLEKVLARVGDGFIALDRDWTCIYVNRRAALILGHAGPKDLLGRTTWASGSGMTARSLRIACEQALATQRPAIVEDHVPQQGLWFESRIYPSSNGLSIYLSDITERKRAEHDLVVSEQRYRLAAAQGQVWDWTAADRRLCVAPEFWSQLGAPTPAPDRTFETFKALVHPDDVDRWEQALFAHLRARVRYDVELRVRHADGEWRWLHTQGQAIWDADGRATYMAGTTFDITARKRAEQSLAEAEAYRRNVFDQLGDGVFLIDREQRFTGANARALAMLGYDHDELLALTASDVMPGFERQRVAREIAAVMDGQPHFDRWLLLRKDGSKLPVEVSARFLDDRHFVCVVRDIALRLQSEQALLTYRDELSELTQRLMSQERATLQRIAQSLHDHVGQTLGAARLNLDAFLSLATPAGPVPPREYGIRVVLLLDQAISEVRQVLADLRPPLLSQQGLSTALATEIESLVITSRRVDVLFEADDGVASLRWRPDVEYSAFMIAREAIANAQQHADASLVRVLLGGDAHVLHLQVIDDGGGIPSPMLQGRAGHLGIVGMRERALAVGADFEIGRADDAGTRVSFRWEDRTA